MIRITEHAGSLGVGTVIKPDDSRDCSSDGRVQLTTSDKMIKRFPIVAEDSVDLPVPYHAVSLIEDAWIAENRRNRPTPIRRQDHRGSGF